MAFLRKLTQSLTISVGLFVAVVALTAFLLPALWPAERPDALHRLARIPLLLLGTGALTILWAAIARKAGWSARVCLALPVVTSFAACTLLAIFVPSGSSFRFLSLSSLGWPVGVLCGKLVYPDWHYRMRSTGAPLKHPTTLHLSS